MAAESGSGKKQGSRTKKPAAKKSSSRKTPAQKSAAKKSSTAKSSAKTSPSDGVTLRIPRRALQIFGVVAALAIVGAAVWYFAIRDTGPSEEELAAQKRAEDQRVAAAAQAKCQGQIGGLLSALEDLDSRISGSGITEPDYLSRVGNVSAAYGETPTKQLDPPCLVSVGIPLESAMNSYIEASNTWNDCISDFNCDVDGIEPELQAKWSKATGFIDQAKQGLDTIGTP